MSYVPISVVMVVYNHQKYVAEAIQSVLEQDHRDFELIIVNDGSTDGSEDVIRSFQDPRIVYLPQENQGPSVATNNGILAARGRHIALICGDDAWYPQRLRRHHECLSSSGHKMIFSWVDLIDEESKPIDGPHPARDNFDRLTRTRAEIVHSSFFDGPQLNGVTAMVERQLFIDADLYHLTSIQAQDFDMFFRLALRHDAVVLPERLVKYRIRAEHGNLSSAKNSPRAWFELFQIYREMLDEVPIDLFREAFRAEVRRPDFSEGLEFELEKAFVFLRHKNDLIRSIGNERLFHLLRDPRNLEIAKERYGLDLKKLYEINRQVDLGGIRQYDELHRLYSELRGWCDELSEAKSFFLSQLASKDSLLADQRRELAARDEVIEQQAKKIQRHICFRGMRLLRAVVDGARSRRTPFHIADRMARSAAWSSLRRLLQAKAPSRPRDP